MLATKVLNAIIGPIVQKARGGYSSEEVGFRFPWQTDPEEESGSIVEGLEDAVKGAFVICLSRAFVTPRVTEDGELEDEERLEPVFDILQHSEDPNIRRECTDDGTVEITAGRDIAKGEELFSQYKSEGEIPYHKFFTRFGFVPGVTEPVANLVAERSTIFFPQRQEV